MKLYKFRPLANQKDFDRSKLILETGRFWCSNIFELNDPMEGVFYAKDRKIIEKIYEEKVKYKICSFSSEEAFKKPIMWSYYANGFKGIAIEVEVKDEVEDKSIKKIEYNGISSINNLSNETIETILTSKLKCWKHEKEYRFLEYFEEHEHPEHEHPIGKITAVYLGKPYEGILNKESICKNSPSLQCYECLARQLVEGFSSGIKFYEIQINEKGLVKRSNKKLA